MNRLSLLAFLLMFSTQSWGVANYTYYKTLTFNADAYISSNLTNKVVNVCIPSSDTDFWTAIQADGDDVRFSTDAAPTVELDYTEAEFNNTTDNGCWKVEVPTLSSSVDTVLRVYYGYVSATNGSNGANTYTDLTYTSCHPLSADAPTGVGDDICSTNTLTDGGTDSATGEVGLGRQFTSANSDYIDGADTPYDYGTGDFGWCYIINTTSSTSFDAVLDKRDNGTSYGFFSLINVTSGTARSGLRTDEGGGTSHFVTSTTSINDGSPHTVCAFFDTSGNLDQRVDGADSQTTSISSSTSVDNSNVLGIGYSSYTSTSYLEAAYMDELVLFSSIPTDIPNWSLAEYRSNEGSWLTIGSEVSSDVIAPIWYSDGTYTPGAQTVTSIDSYSALIPVQPAGNNCDQIGGAGALACRTDNTAVQSLRVYYVESSSCGTAVDTSTALYQEYTDSPLTRTTVSLVLLEPQTDYCVEAHLWDGFNLDINTVEKSLTTTAETAQFKILDESFAGEHSNTQMYPHDQTYEYKYTIDENGYTIDASASTTITAPTSCGTLGASNETSGNLPNDTYYLTCTWATRSGRETEAGTEVSQITTGVEDAITLTAPAFPSDAQMFRVYVSDTTGTGEQLYGIVRNDNTSFDTIAYVADIPQGAFGASDANAAPTVNDTDFYTATLSNILIKDGTVDIEFVMNSAGSLDLGIRQQLVHAAPLAPREDTGITFKLASNSCDVEEKIRDAISYAPTAVTDDDCKGYDNGQPQLARFVFDGVNLDIYLNDMATAKFTTTGLQTQSLKNQSGNVLIATNGSVTIKSVRAYDKDSNYTDNIDYWNRNNRAQMVLYHGVSDDIDGGVVDQNHTPINVVYKDITTIREQGFNVVTTDDIKNWLDDPATYFLPKNPFLIEWYESGSEGGAWEIALPELATYGVQFAFRNDPDRWGAGTSAGNMTLAHAQEAVNAGHSVGGDMEWNTQPCYSRNKTDAEIQSTYWGWMEEFKDSLQDAFGYPVTAHSMNTNCHAQRANLRDEVLSNPDMSWTGIDFADKGGIDQYRELKTHMNRQGVIGNVANVQTDSSIDLDFYNYVERLDASDNNVYEKVLLDSVINRAAKREDSHLVYDNHKVYIDHYWTDEYVADFAPDGGAYTWTVTSGATPTEYIEDGYDKQFRQYTSGSDTDSWRYFKKTLTGSEGYAEVESYVTTSPTPGLIESGTSEPYFAMTLTTSTGVRTCAATIGTDQINLYTRVGTTSTLKDQKKLNDDGKQHIHGFAMYGNNCDFYRDGVFMQTISNTSTDTGAPSEIEWGLSAGATAEVEVFWNSVRYVDGEVGRHNYGTFESPLLLVNASKMYRLFWNEFQNGTGQVSMRHRECTTTLDSSCGAWSGTETTLHSGDSGWSTSDGANTVLSYPTVNPAPIEGSAALKVSTTDSASNGDYASVTISAADLSDDDLLHMWVYSDQAGCGDFSFGVGEGATPTGMISQEICIDKPLTWQEIFINMGKQYGAAYLGVDTFYSMDELDTRYDLPGASDLTENGTVPFRAGKFSKAAEFDNNTSNYLASSNDACSVAASCVWGAWIDTDRAAGTLEYFQSSAGKALYIDASGYPVCLIDTGTSATAIGASIIADGATVTHNWVHCEYDGTNLSAYVNAETVVQTAKTGTIASASANRFGQVIGGTNPVDGTLDGYYEYSGTWTASQRAEAYNSGTGLDFRDKNYENSDAVVTLFVQVNDDAGSPYLVIDDMKALSTYTRHAGSDLSGVTADTTYWQAQFILTSQDRKRSPTIWPEFDILYQGSPLVYVTGLEALFNKGFER